MRAAVLDAIDAPLQVQDVTIAEPRAGEALVRVVACGLCHSDYSCAHGVLRAPTPSVLGHEMGGVVEAVGAGVDDLAPGDHVVATLTPACGACAFCAEDKPFLCLQAAPMMVDATMLDGSTRLTRGDETVYQLCGIGGFAEQAIVPAGALVKVDPEAPLDLVCVLGCGVLTGTGAVWNTAQVEAGATVAVLGCGGVGLAVVQGARIAGARQIIAIDPVAERRKLALELGATDELDPADGDAAKAVKKMAAGGVHYAFEAVGRVDTIAQTFNMVRPSGMAVVVGVPKISDEIPLRASGFVQGKRMVGSLYGSSNPRRDIPRLVDYYRGGELMLDNMVTHRIPLDRVNEAFDLMTTGGGARAVVTMG
ncbi:MAG: Zn-dependent alcohol dehydrogenase [Salinisphaera sp.]|nr:Zn-dependent alcohol dehydrogenase [Salinisphaera sp.]